MNFTIKNKNFSFAFRIEDLDANLIDDDRLIYVDFVYYNYEIQNEKWILLERKSIPHNKCKESDFGIEEQYDKQNFKNWFCPNLDNTPIGENWDESYIKFFRIYVYKCSEGEINKLTNLTCKTSKEFSQLTKKRIFFSTFCQKYNINPSDYLNPFNTIYLNSFNMIDTNIMKRNLYYFKYGTVKTDYGWIFKSYEETSSFSMDNIFSDIMSISLLPIEDRNLIFESGIYFNKDLENFIRTYSKIQDLAAVVGGIIKIFLIFSKFLMTIYSEKVILYESLQDLYYVTCIEDKIKENNPLSSRRELNDLQLSKVKINSTCVKRKNTIKFSKNFINLSISTENRGNSKNSNEQFTNINLKGNTNEKSKINNDENYKETEKIENFKFCKLNKFEREKIEKDGDTSIRKFKTKDSNKKIDNKMIFSTMQINFYKFFCFYKNKEKEKYLVLVSKIKEAYDVKTYLNILKNIKRLRFIMLNEFENLPFDYIKKENIDSISIDENIIIEKIRKINLKREKINKNKNKREIKIFENLEENLSNKLLN